MRHMHTTACLKNANSHQASSQLKHLIDLATNALDAIGSVDYVGFGVFTRVIALDMVCGRCTGSC